MMKQYCPECGADWSSGVTCEEHFHQMGFWELADLEHLGVVHHLMVLCYHLQHPSLYSPEGLAHAQGLLVDFVVRGVTPQQVRQRDHDKVDSGKRQFKIKGTPESHGSYEHPVAWTMRAADVVAGGTEHYVENVRAWAQSVYESLTAAHVFQLDDGSVRSKPFDINATLDGGDVLPDFTLPVKDISPNKRGAPQTTTFLKK